MNRFTFFALFCTLAGFCASTLRAQEPANPILPPVNGIPAPVIPNAAQTSVQAVSAPISPQENLQNSKTGKAEAKIAQLVKFRKVQMRAERNPQAIEALARSKSAKTYADETAARREYYTLLYNFMEKEAPDLKTLIEEQRTIDIGNKLPKLKKHRSKNGVPHNTL